MTEEEKKAFEELKVVTTNIFRELNKLKIDLHEEKILKMSMPEYTLEKSFYESMEKLERDENSD